MKEPVDDLFAGNISRRKFIERATAAGLTLAVLGNATENEICAQIGKQTPPAKPGTPLRGLPALDGSLTYEHTSLELAATDQGGIVHRLPRAVLQPGSVEDVVRMVRYAHAKRLPVAMRGRGHSAYGQTLVDGGIVIDSSTLDRVVSVSGKAIEGSGCLSGDGGSGRVRCWIPRTCDRRLCHALCRWIYKRWRSQW